MDTEPPATEEQVVHDFGIRHIDLHGHHVSYRMAGEGPAIILLHGVTGSSTTWREVMPALAERHTVLAPDLLGHGESAKPRGDYSLGAFASGVRDLMVALGIERATVVGHSLGGGIALQFAYQFPQRCERLVLVSSGGLGKEVSIMLRAVSLPGAEVVMPIILHRAIPDLLEAVTAKLGRGRLRMGVRGREIWRSYRGLTEVRGRMAFIHTIRSVVDVSGQRVSARDRLYLASGVPTLIIWGDQDRIIPVEHAHAAHELMPGSELVVVPGAGHFVPFEAPEPFLAALEAFLDSSEPSHTSEEGFRDLLLEHQT